LSDAARARPAFDPALAADLGAHVSVAGGVSTCFERAAEIGAGAAQIFVKNQRQWVAKPLAADEIKAFAKARAASAVKSVVAHATYLVNLAAVDEANLEKSIACLADEMARAEALGLEGVIVHPGSSKDGREAGIARIAAALPRVIAASGAKRTRLLLEGTAGGGDQVGGRFEDLAEIIAATPAATRARLGVCVDTCHMHVAGYALSSAKDLSALLDELDAVVGLSRLAAIHANDAKAARGSKLDRHANLGQGTIGLACFEALVNEPRLAGVPKVLETPEEDDGHAKDLALLVSMRGGAKKATVSGRKAKK